MKDYFLNVLPPFMFPGVIQISEPDSQVEGKMTYATLHYVEGQWTYVGTCHKGQTVNKVNPIGVWYS